MAESVRSHYNQTAVESTTNNHPRSPRVQRNGIRKCIFIERVLGSLGVKRVLDLGCGRITDLYKYGEMDVQSVVGIDFSDEAIKEAEHRVSLFRSSQRRNRDMEVKFIIGDITSPELHERILESTEFIPFDAVASCFSLNYVSNNIEGMAHFVYSALKPGGVWYGIVAKGECIYQFARKYPQGDGEVLIEPIDPTRYVFSIGHHVQKCQEYTFSIPQFFRTCRDIGFGHVDSWPLCDEDNVREGGDNHNIELYYAFVVRKEEENDENPNHRISLIPESRSRSIGRISRSMFGPIIIPDEVMHELNDVLWNK